MDVDSPGGGGREQGVLKEDEEAARGLAVLLSVSSSRLAPNLTPLHQGCVTLSPSASRHCALSLFCKEPRGQTRPSQALTFISVATTELSNLAQTNFCLPRLVTMTLNLFSGRFLR